MGSSGGFAGSSKASGSSSLSGGSGSLAEAVPGVPGEDYPTFAQVPETSFQCDGQIEGGYYADLDTDCQAFHICAADAEGGLTKYSFLCPNGTLFNQQYFICDWWFNVDCSLAESFYSRNDEVASERDAYTVATGSQAGGAVGARQSAGGQSSLRGAASGQAGASAIRITAQTKTSSSGGSSSAGRRSGSSSVSSSAGRRSGSSQASRGHSAGSAVRSSSSGSASISASSSRRVSSQAAAGNGYASPSSGGAAGGFVGSQGLALDVGL